MTASGTPIALVTWHCPNSLVAAVADGQQWGHVFSEAAPKLIEHPLFRVGLLGRRYHFEAGESIHTENSYKYSLAQFQDLARSANWLPRRVWTDADRLFSVHELTSA
jgi:hypothetical protein